VTIWQAILLAIVEGITEFLPVSSTGHMIIVSHFLGISNDEFVKLFEVNIQFGAILSVLVLYYKRLFKSIDIYFKLLAAFVPTAILGLLLDDYIDQMLESVLVVAVSLFVGGIVLLFADKWFKKNTSSIDDLSLPKSASIGLFQAISMIPGVSRSAATIIGGQAQGLTKEQAAEFSFLLAIPTMAAASGLKILKGKDMLLAATSDQWMILAVGNLVAFLVAILAIKAFIGILMRAGFKPFGYYRIVLGALLLVLILTGTQLSL
jgi:undecaprenyl-diphosphatase